MVTNTFTPHVGGVARSVAGFAARYRELGHRVLVAAPQFPGAPPVERDVIRVRALQNFNGSDFSVPFPVTRLLHKALELCPVDVVHSHHPFLLGDTALRISAAQDAPIVFTHHTQYERYTHYVPGDSPRLQRFAVDLVTGYCNLCDAVIAPSESVADVLKERGVVAPIHVIPTGVDTRFFAAGNGAEFRHAHDIPRDAVVVGHVGRLAPEKNLDFLARALAAFAKRDAAIHVVVVGDGPCTAEIQEVFERSRLTDRIHLTGTLPREALPDAYRAMDVFAFASHTETQGMVLTEAMAAGVPAVALDAPGAREVIRDRYNGCLLANENIDDFVRALAQLTAEAGAARLAEAIAETAKRFSMEGTADTALALYRGLLDSRRRARSNLESTAWAGARRRIAEEWKIFANRAEAARHAWLEPASEQRQT